MTGPRPETWDTINVARRNIIKRNIRKLQDSGASDEEIYNYLTEGEGLSAPEAPKPRGKLEDVARSVMGGGAAAIATIPAMADVVLSKAMSAVVPGEVKPSKEIQRRPQEVFLHYTKGGPQTKTGAGASIAAGLLTAPLTSLPLVVSAALSDPAFSSGHLIEMIARDKDSSDESVRNRIADITAELTKTAAGRAVIEGAVQALGYGAVRGVKGALGYGKGAKAGVAGERVPVPDVEITPSAEPVVQPAAGTRAAAELEKAQRMTAEGEALVQRRQINSSERAIYQAEAKAEWLKANPDKGPKDWKKLSPSEKVDLYRARIQATPDAWKSPEARTLGGLDQPIEPAAGPIIAPVIDESVSSAVPESPVAPVAPSGPRHGTGINEAVGIIRSGLKPGSSIDVGSGLSQGQEVTFEFGPIKKSKAYFRMSGEDPGSHTTGSVETDIKRVFLDLDEYSNREDAEEAFAQLRQALDETGRKDIPIESAKWNDETQTFSYGGKPDITRLPSYVESLKRMSPRSLEKESDRLFASMQYYEIDQIPQKLNNKLDLLSQEMESRGLLPSAEPPVAPMQQTPTEPRYYVSTAEATGREFTAEEKSTRDLAERLKIGDDEAIETVAPEMAARLSDNALLIPLPDSKGNVEANQKLARAIAAIRPGTDVLPAVGRLSETESSMLRRRAGRIGLTADEQASSMSRLLDVPPDRPVFLVDNIEVTGSTAEGARRVLDAPQARTLTFAKAAIPPGEKPAGALDQINDLLARGDEALARTESLLEPRPALQRIERGELEAEQLGRAAIRTSDGQVFEGDIHASARAAARESGVNKSDVIDAEDGYVTTAGRFVTEKEAAKIAGIEDDYLDSDVLRKVNEAKGIETPRTPQQLSRLKPSQMSDAERGPFATWLYDRMTSLPEGENAIYKEKLHEINAFEEKRLQQADYAAWKEKWLSEGFKAEIPPSLVGGVSGFVYGLNSGPDDEEASAKIARASMWGLAGAVGTKGLAWAWANRRRITPQLNPKGDLPPSVVKPSPVIHYAFDTERLPKSLWTRLGNFFTGSTRRVYPAERMVTERGTLADPAEKNWYKRAVMYGRAPSRTLNWLSLQPDHIGPNGEPIPYEGVLSLEKIYHELGQGNIAELDKLRVARASIKEINAGRPAPMPAVEAMRIIAGAPDYLHKAADAARDYDAALFDVLRRYGRVSDEAYAKAIAEEEWYAPLQRVLYGERQKDIWRGRQTSVSSGPGAYERKGGSTIQVRSPYEANIEATARIMRFEEFQSLGRSVKEWVKNEFPEEIGNTIMQRIDAKRVPNFEKGYEKIKELRKNGLPDDQAEMLASILDAGVEEVSGPGGTTYTLPLWENGKRAVYRVNKDIFDTFKNLTPMEFDGFVKFLGAPSRAATTAIVHNPFFPYWQFFKDAFSTQFTALYGFRPVYESLRGLGHIYSRSPEYQNLLRVGAPATSQTFQYTTARQAATALRDVGENALSIAMREAKEMRFADAYRTLVFPLAEAGRVGAYLRALDHKQSTLEAAYAAWVATGNVRMQGSSQTAQALNYVSMFARPAFAALDETSAFAGINIFRSPPGGETRPVAFTKFIAKGLGALVPLAAATWYANKDDEEINQIRRTEQGSRYLWYRIFGKLHKIPKPPIVGPMFMTTVETALDKMYAKDPEGTTSWLKSLYDDAAVNMVPPMAGIPLSLGFNRVVGLGSPVVPDRLAELEPGLMEGSGTTKTARGISQVLVGATKWAEPTGAFARAVSPAGVQFIIRSLSGYSGEDVLKAGDWALKYSEEGRMPPLEEFPVIGKAFGRYPSMAVGPVSEFYRTGDRVDKASKSYAEYIRQGEIERAVGYLDENISYIQLAPLYAKSRDEIAELRRAIEDVKNAPESVISGTQKRKVEEEYLRLIITQAQIANQIARATLKAQQSQR